MAHDIRIVFSTKEVEHILRILGKHMVQVAEELAMMRLGDYEDTETVERFRSTRIGSPIGEE